MTVFIRIFLETTLLFLGYLGILGVASHLISGKFFKKSLFILMIFYGFGFVYWGVSGEFLSLLEFFILFTLYWMGFFIVVTNFTSSISLSLLAQPHFLGKEISILPRLKRLQENRYLELDVACSQMTLTPKGKKLGEKMLAYRKFLGTVEWG